MKFVSNKNETYMKKPFFKEVKIIATTFILSLSFISCNSDDAPNYEQPGAGSIDVAVGTFKGKITSYKQLPNTSEYTFYDAVVIVTKVDDQHLKITTKSGEPYSALTEKTLKVSNEYDNMVRTVIGEINGDFWYTHDTKSLTFYTNDSSVGDYDYGFEGIKQ